MTLIAYRDRLLVSSSSVYNKWRRFAPQRYFLGWKGVATKKVGAIHELPLPFFVDVNLEDALRLDNF